MQPGPEVTSRAVGVAGEQHHVVARHVGGVDAGGGHRQAEPVAHDRGVAAASDHAHGLGRERLVAVAAADLALDLAHHLAGDHDDVAVDHGVLARGQDGEQQTDQVVAGAHLRHAVGGVHRQGHETRSRAATAIAAVASWSVIRRGTARQAIPAAVTAGTSPASTVSTSQPSSSPPAARAP